MTLQEYIASLRGRTVAVIGIGVSNTPLLRLLLRSGVGLAVLALPSQPATAATGRSWALWRRSWRPPEPCCGWATGIFRAWTRT